MAINANQFLDKLEEQGLLQDNVIASLRKQVAAKKKISAQAVAKLLVDKGHLTPFQAKKFLEDGNGAAAPEKEPKVSVKPAAAPIADTDMLIDMDDADDKAEEEDEEIVDLSPVAAPAQPAAKWKGEKKKRASSTPTGQGEALTPLAADDAEVIEETAPLTPLPANEPAMLEDISSLGPLDDLQSYDPLGGAAGPGMAHGMAHGTAAGPLTATAQKASPEAAFRGKRFRPDQWRSNWWWILLIVVPFLAVISLFLWYVLSKGNSTELFNAAEDSYKNGRYGEAIERYDLFIKRFSSDENASQARVRREMASLWSQVESKNWDRAMDTANEVLPKIKSEDWFTGKPDARQELAGLLPGIVEGYVGLAEKAQKAGNTDEAEKQLKQANKAMELVTNPTYIPSSERVKPTFEARQKDIEEAIGVVKREISKERKLVAALGEIEKLVAAEKTVEAFQVRANLLSEYPGLVADERLVKAVVSIATKEKDLVKVESTEMAAETKDHEPNGISRVVLASHTGAPVQGYDNYAAAFLINGSVYALNVGDGRVLWRRYVGYQRLIEPQPISQQAGADVILVDTQRDELVRVKADTGQLVWRLPVGEPFFTPLITRDRIVVTGQSGRVYDVDPTSGQSARQVRLPQSLSVGAGTEPGFAFYYQTGNHSNLYVLSSGDLGCREVYYLGHKSGSIHVPPVMVQNHLLIAENAGANYSYIHVLRTSRGVQLEKAQERVRLRGHVVTPPIQYGRRLLFVTNLGAVHVFEVDPSNEKRPVSDIANYPSTSSQPITVYPVTSEGQLWIAERRFSRFDIQTARGELKRAWVSHEGDTFVAPCMVFGNTVLHVRRHRRSAGVSVCAVNGDSGVELWRTDVAVPLAGAPIVDVEANRIMAVNAQAELFAVDQATRDAGYVSQSTENVGTLELDLAFSDRADIGNGRVAFTGRPEDNRILVYDPSQSGKMLRVVRRDKSAGDTTSRPVGFAGGLLVPGSKGQVLLVDAGNGSNLMLPFQPPLEADSSVTWFRPAVLEDGKEFVIADDRQKLYRVMAVSDNKAHLAAVGAPAPLDGDATSPVAVVGDTAFLVSRDGAADSVVSFTLPGLKFGTRTPLDGRVILGPENVGDAVLLASDTEGLMCLDAGHKVRWVAQLKHGPLVGTPAAVGADFVVATQSGMLLRIDGGTGEVAGEIDVAEPLSVGPVEFDGKLLVGGHDGSLHAVPLP